MKKLKKFQEQAKEQLFKRSTDIISEKDTHNNLITFKSPTGSGKTFTMTKYIEAMIEWSREENVEKEIAFLWVSIGKGDLEEQSYNSINSNIQGETKVYKIDEVYQKDYLNSGDIVVFNWEKIRSRNKAGQWTNIVMKDQEEGNFVRCLEKTKERGTIIILIVDESHAVAEAQRAKELKAEIINADLTIDVSATPTLKGHTVNVDASKVIKEGMIKKEVIINSNLGEGNTETILLDSAYDKMKELKKAYKDNGVKIKPLCLIQLPNAEEGDEKRQIVEEFLNQKGITSKKEKLAIHLNQERLNSEREILCEYDNSVEYLIFKQAIDTGWDCPRAHVLIRFRETSNIVFDLQTVGRILRMPEQKHYGNPILDNAYVYTSDSQYEIAKESDPGANIIKKASGNRKNEYEDIKLKSFYKNRTDFGDVEADFYELSLKKIFCDNLGKNKTELKEKGIEIPTNPKETVIMDNEIIQTESLDQRSQEGLRRTGVSMTGVSLSNNDLETSFNEIIKNNLNSFAPSRSIETVRSSIYRYFMNCIGIKPGGDGIILMQSIVLKDNNKIKFCDAINRATLDYKGKKAKKNLEEQKNSGKDNDWEVPELYYLNPNTKESHSFKKFIIEGKNIAKYDSDIERRFAEYLDKSKDVKWWYKNGSEHKQENFGIKYEKQSDIKTFQPDFIVQFLDDSIGIFDTKAVDHNVDDTKIKAEALQKYIRNTKGKDLSGGIIIKNKARNFYINNKSTYRDFKGSQGDWEPLSF